MTINQKAVNKTYKKRSGVVMFPSSHDITPMVKNECFIVLKKLLESGNRVIIVSKPNLSIIAELCEKFKKYQEQLLLRFTLTSICEDTLRFWEPGAPTFQERLAALQYAYEHGFTTSVSIEPFLTNPQHTYNFVRDYVNESVWIGIMSGIPKFENPIHQQFSEAVKMLRDTSNLKDVYERMKNLKYIRFKDGFMNALILNLKKVA